MEESSEIVVLKNPYLLYDVQCPKCRCRALKPTSAEVKCRCDKCGHAYKADAHLNYLYAYCSEILKVLGAKDHCHVHAERLDNNIHTADLSPQSKKEQDYIFGLLAFKNLFKKNNFVVSEITKDMASEFKISCLDCGYCNNCVKCNRCMKHYVPKRTKRRGKPWADYVCPYCNAMDYNKSYTKEIVKNKKCQHCGSNDITLNKFESSQKQCPNCESKNIKKPRKVNIYKLVISRPERYREHFAEDS